jgi:hypothetical protein
MLSHLSWNAAALSLVVPGWGQHDQGRAVAGCLFLGWAVFSILAAAYGTVIGMPSVLGWADSVVATVWSAVDAFFHDPVRAVAA